MPGEEVQLELAQQAQLFLIAAVLGGLIGLERQFAKTDAKGTFVGVRTFMFISLFGAMCAFVAHEHMPWFPIIGFFALIAIVITRYFLEARSGDIGITTEVTEFLVFLVGAITFWNHVALAIMLAVGITLILSLKPELEKVTRRVEAEDIRAIIKFAIISFIIFPLLQDKPIDSRGLFNPREVWLMVVLISGVSFAGYFILKFAKVSGALELTGLFGGIVSSTAVTLSFSRRSKDLKDMWRHLALGILLAQAVMFPRLLLLISVVSRKLLGHAAIPLGAMFLTGLIAILIQWMRYRMKGEHEEETAFRNPFEISTALTFGAIYAAIRILAELAIKFYGNSGLYVASILSGVAETDAITLSIARMVEVPSQVVFDPAAAADRSVLDTQTAAIAVTLAVIMNTLFKGSIVFFIGSKEIKKPIVISCAAMIAVGLIAILFL